MLQLRHTSDFQSVYFILFYFQFCLTIRSSSGAQDLDSIRLSTYRTACKLRFVQKKCNCESNPVYILLRSHKPPLQTECSCRVALFPVHLVDIWNVIEAFRENGLNNMELSAELAVARLEVVLSTIFYQLSKRMPTTHQISMEQSISLLLNFLLAAYDP